MSSTIRSFARIFRRTRAILRWVTNSVGSTSSRSSGKSRLLMIYDFGSQPFSIGDILVFVAVSEALRYEKRLSKVDFALVFEEDRPVVEDPAFSHINRENFRFLVSDIISAVGICPALGSTLVFDSHAALENFVDTHHEAYFVWPDAFDYASKEYLYYKIFNKLLFDFHKNAGFVPELQITGPLKRWADEFVQQHAENRIPVSVQLRRNAKNPARDSDYDEWLTFFAEAHSRHGVKFILIGDRSESDPRLGRCPGLVTAKNYGTSIVQDLALISACRFHMGASSGPSVMAIFSKKPYCLFNTDVRGDLLKGSISEGNRTRFFFANRAQSMVAGKENHETLMREFTLMLNALATTER